MPHLKGSMMWVLHGRLLCGNIVCKGWEVHVEDRLKTNHLTKVVHLAVKPKHREWMTCRNANLEKWLASPRSWHDSSIVSASVAFLRGREKGMKWCNLIAYERTSHSSNKKRLETICNLNVTLCVWLIWHQNQLQRPRISLVQVIRDEPATTL